MGREEPPLPSPFAQSPHALSLSQLKLALKIISVSGCPSPKEVGLPVDLSRGVLPPLVGNLLAVLRVEVAGEPPSVFVDGTILFDDPRVPCEGLVVPDGHILLELIDEAKKDELRDESRNVFF